jgi:hypothetical protein
MTSDPEGSRVNERGAKAAKLADPTLADIMVALRRINRRLGKIERRLFPEDAANAPAEAEGEDEE